MKREIRFVIVRFLTGYLSSLSASVIRPASRRYLLGSSAASRTRAIGNQLGLLAGKVIGDFLSFLSSPHSQNNPVLGARGGELVTTVGI
jgi:hypothetical protein